MKGEQMNWGLGLGNSETSKKLVGLAKGISQVLKSHEI